MMKQKLKEREVHTSGWRKRDLFLLNECASKTSLILQTDGNLWSFIEKYCLEVHGMYRTKASVRCKWLLMSFASECQMLNSSYNEVLSMNRTGDEKKSSLGKMTHAIYQSKIRKEKETNTCIGIIFSL